MFVKKWQITLIALFMFALVAAVFAALPDTDLAKVRRHASRHTQFASCGVDLKTKSNLDTFSDSVDLYRILGFKDMVHPIEDLGLEPIVKITQYANDNVSGNQWDVVALEIVRRDKCFETK